MFTRNRLPPFYPTGEWTKDAPALLKWISDYWLVLETKGALTIDQASITASSGIKFPATQVASSDANTLDDFEEGTWTPTDGSGAGLAFTVTRATYVKIGRLVSISLNLTYPATASGANTQINGLPFSAANVAASNLFTNGAGGGTCGQINGTVVNLFAPGAVAITNANLTGKFVIMNFTYEV